MRDDASNFTGVPYLCPKVLHICLRHNREASHAKVHKCSLNRDDSQSERLGVELRVWVELKKIIPEISLDKKTIATKYLQEYKSPLVDYICLCIISFRVSRIFSSSPETSIVRRELCQLHPVTRLSLKCTWVCIFNFVAIFLKKNHSPKISSMVTIKLHYILTQPVFCEYGDKLIYWNICICLERHGMV